MIHRLHLLLLALLLPNTLWAVDIQRWESLGDAKVYFVRTTELPMLDIRLVFDAGSARAGKNFGLAGFTARMLEEGAGGMDNEEVSKRISLTGAQYGGSSNANYNFATLRVLTERKYLDPALSMFITVLSKPDFPPASLQRLVAQSLVNIEERKQQPATLASVAFSQAVYGDHPYAHPEEEEEKQALKNTTPELLRQFYKRYYVSSNMKIILVGDITREQAGVIAERIAGSLPKGKPAEPIPPVPKSKAQNIHIPFDSKQVHVYIGHTGPTVDDPIYYPLRVANHIFGGSGFGSRLMQEIRVKNGYAYSVSSHFTREKAGGNFRINFQTKLDQAKDATRIAIDMLKEFHLKGVTQDELELAKESIANGFPLGMGNNSNITGWVQHIAANQLELDYLDKYVPTIRKVDKDAVQKAIQKHIHPDNLITVTVGG